MDILRKHKNLLDDISKLGVEFTVFGSSARGGYHNLSVTELIEYLKDPKDWRDRLGAEQLGVTRQQFHIWSEFILNPQCKGITTKGRQCRRQINNIPGPQNFVGSIDCYCKWHSKLG